MSFSQPRAFSRASSTQNVAGPQLPWRRVLKAGKALDEHIAAATGFGHLDAKAGHFSIHDEPAPRGARLWAAGLSVSTLRASFRPIGILAPFSVAIVTPDDVGGHDADD